jgi:putative membrane protein
MELKRFMSILMVATVLWTACDDNDDDNNTDDRTSLSAEDKEFLESAAMANLEQRTFGLIAVQQGNDTLVRSWGKRMVDDYTIAMDEIEEISTHYDNVTLPANLTADRATYRDQLTASTGYQFDSLYMNNLMTDFNTLKTKYQNTIDNSTENRIKSFASKYLPDLDEYIMQTDSIITVINQNNGVD